MTQKQIDEIRKELQYKESIDSYWYDNLNISVLNEMLDYIEVLKSENAEFRARLDKAVELPVRSGQKLYCLHHEYERVLKGVVYQVEYGEGNIDCRCKSDFQVDCSPIKETGNWTLYLHYTKKDIGEKVFFTRELAEEALKNAKQR